MSRRCELRKEYHKEVGRFKDVDKYSDSYVKWLEDKIINNMYLQQFYCYDKIVANAEEDFDFLKCEKQCEKCNNHG